MAQTQGRTAAQPAVVRSEQLVDRIGQNIGSFAALSRQRVQQTATRVGERFASIQTELTTRSQAAQGKQPNQPGGKITGGPVPPGGLPQAEMQRAEGLVDDIGQRLALLTSTVGLQIRKMAAYAREGAEDIWVEAQHMRPARSRRVSPTGK
jgi:hypothetical protein